MTHTFKEGDHVTLKGKRNTDGDRDEYILTGRVNPSDNYNFGIVNWSTQPFWYLRQTKGAFYGYYIRVKESELLLLEPTPPERYTHTLPEL